MRFKEYIDEEYIGNVRNGPYEAADIFKNPSLKELAEACKHDRSCRFMIDTIRKDIYVWSYVLLHTYVEEYLKKSIPGVTYPDHNGDYIWGTAVKEKTKLHATNWYNYQRKKKDLKWTEYIFGDTIINKIGYIEEEYLTQEIGYDIFVNPSIKELKECENNIRFIINFKTEKLYVWDAYKDIHQSVINMLFDKKLITDRNMFGGFLNDCVAGIALRTGSKLKFIDMFEGGWWLPNYNGNKLIFKKSWWYKKPKDEWLNQWFDMPFVATLKERIKAAAIKKEKIRALGNKEKTGAVR
jgi:hypothetical protein